MHRGAGGCKASIHRFFKALRQGAWRLVVFLAQLVEQLTLNQWVEGSSPSEDTQSALWHSFFVFGALTLSPRVSGSYLRFAPNDLLRGTSPSEDTQSTQSSALFCFLGLLPSPQGSRVLISASLRTICFVPPFLRKCEKIGEKGGKIVLFTWTICRYGGKVLPL